MGVSEALLPFIHHGYFPLHGEGGMWMDAAHGASGDRLAGARLVDHHARLGAGTRPPTESLAAVHAPTVITRTEASINRVIRAGILHGRPGPVGHPEKRTTDIHHHDFGLLARQDTIR